MDNDLKMEENTMVDFLPDLNGHEFMDMLKDEPDIIQQLLSNNTFVPNDPNLNDVNNGDMIDINQPPFYVDEFHNFSTSDTSLSEQHSPENPSCSQEYVPYGIQYSPGSGSIDSGVTQSVDSPYGIQYSPGSGSIDSGVAQSIESPQLSPDSISGYYNQDYIGENFINSSAAQDISNIDVQKGEILKFIQQQVQQALSQQQTKDQQQQQLQYQQQILLISQMQQQQKQVKQKDSLVQQNNFSLEQTTVSTTKNSDSQLRRMLSQTKNIFSSIHDKTGKMPSLPKFKSCNSKLSKRKLPNNSDEDKIGKVIALNSSGNVPLPVKNESSPANTLEALLMQQSKQATSNTSSLTPQSTLSSKLSSLVYSQFSDSPTATNPKVPIQRLKSQNQPSTVLPKERKEIPKKARVEHVVIEKRYRMKITDSLNELKNMLSCSEDKKATKNTILQAAIDEIKKLKKTNDALSRKNHRLVKLLEQMHIRGFISTSQPVSSASSESNISDDASSHLSDDVTNIVEPESNQDHYASPLLRPSARDGAKLISCFALFTFLFVNPLNLLVGKAGSTKLDGSSHSSRRLLGISTEEPSPHFSLASNLLNIVFSVVVLMFMLLRGNPRCSKYSKLTQCFQSQLNKAQKKINKHEYEDAKGLLRIALFVIGNSCPKTVYGQIASFLWKCFCHILYQLGIVTFLESVGRSILPSALSHSAEKSDREFAAKLSVEAYMKLHEIALKDPSSSYLEAACYIMNTIQAAEVSGDQELLCTAYATAVVHMKEKTRLLSYCTQYYFTFCAHHASLANKDEPFAVDWIFENRGYEYFTSGSWDIKKPSAFHVHGEDSELDEDDLLQIVYTQFQEHVLVKVLKRIVVPETSYPNEGKIELRQRANSFLDHLATGPVSEQVDAVSLYYQSLYGWWAVMLKHYIYMVKSDIIDKDDLRIEDDLFEDINDHHRHENITVMKAVMSCYVAVRSLRQRMDLLMVLPTQLLTESNKIRMKLLETSQMLILSKLLVVNEHMKENHVTNIQELIVILCCDLMVKANYFLWEINSKKVLTEQELNLLLNENEVLQSFTSKYPELFIKVQEHDFEIQAMSGANECELNRLLKRNRHMKSRCAKKNDHNNIYFSAKHYPLKQDGFIH